MFIFRFTKSFTKRPTYKILYKTKQLLNMILFLKQINQCENNQVISFYEIKSMENFDKTFENSFKVFIAIFMYKNMYR